MTNALTDALADLIDAVRLVPGVNVYRADSMGTIRTPAVVVGLPAIGWRTYRVSGPTVAEFPVHLVVSMDEYAMGRLFDLVLLVQDAIVANTPAGVNQGNPIPFDNPTGSPMAAYELTTMYPLTNGG